MYLCTPLHKKDDTRDEPNYRPTSMLPLLSKVFEKAVHILIQLPEFFVRNNILDQNLHGFRSGRSTSALPKSSFGLVLQLKTYFVQLLQWNSRVAVGTGFLTKFVWLLYIIAQ